MPMFKMSLSKFNRTYSYGVNISLIASKDFTPCKCKMESSVTIGT